MTGRTVENSAACGYNFLTHARSTLLACQPSADREVEVKLLATGVDGARSRAVSPVLGDALQNAGYGIEWISKLDPQDLQRPAVIIGELAVIDYLATEVRGWPAFVSWLPVAVHPTESELSAARDRYGYVLVAPGKLSQVVGIVDALTRDRESEHVSK